MSLTEHSTTPCNVTGRIHSVETGGMVDGPGIRFVLFTQGCPLRCQYCHNPDTWKAGGGREVTAGEIMEQAMKYRRFMETSGGGMTITGGEPLLQPDFTAALLKEGRKGGIHMAVDTSGFGSEKAREKVLPLADLVLLDIKSIKPDRFKEVAGVARESTMASLELLARESVPVWIRHVVVPGLTDSEEEAQALARALLPYPNIQRVELLPFHKMGEFKWKELGLEYRLGETPVPTKGLMDRLGKLFREKGLPLAE